MSEKKTFLLSRSKNILSNSSQAWVYDDQANLNLVNFKGESVPVCSLESIVTQSKTDSAPGDDDPDTDADYIY